MREQGLRLGAAVVAVAGLAIGILAGDWWSYEAERMPGLMFGSVGLRGLEHCAMGSCRAVPFDDQLTGGAQFLAAANVTYFLGLATAALLAVGALLRELGKSEQPVRIAGYLCAVVLLTAIVTLVTFPDDSDRLAFTIDYGFFATAGGAIAGLFASRLRVGTWRDAVPDRPPPLTGRPAVRTEPIATASPGAGAGQPVADYDYQQAIRKATSVAPVGRGPKALKKLGRPSAARVADAAADAARGSLRFVARAVTLGDDGLEVSFEDGGTRSLGWADIDEVVARRLPPDPPFDKLLLVDLVSDGRPVRLLPSTQVNYDALPGGAAPTSRDNLRALGVEAARRKPGIIEAQSAGFFTGSQMAPLFQAVRQFAAYDARYS